jgi:hypothetical protein
MKNQPHNQPDARLDALLRALPDKPVASNFTARVLQQVERENAARPAGGSFAWFRLHWLPRLAVASLALASCVLTYQVRTEAHRTQFARSVAAITQVSSLPSPDTLKDFEAIRRLSQTPPADRELLALLQ